MPDDPPIPIDRRACLRALSLPALAWLPGGVGAAPADEVARLLRAGGVVFVMRHARAPGTFDPPGFRLGDCSTQRNLDAGGRAQAAEIGRWFRQQGLTPSAVRSSPWCRCMDTATLAFGRAEPWPPLGSPRAHDEAARAAHLQALSKALAEVHAQPRTAPGRFEVWVTHMFVLSAWLGESASSGEGLVVSAASGTPRVLARLEA